MRGKVHRHVALVAAEGEAAPPHAHAAAAPRLSRERHLAAASFGAGAASAGGDRLGAALGRGLLGVGVTMQHEQPAIEFRDLTLGYDRHPAVHHISGEVAQGELLAIVGPNGAGKSTLLKGIMGELKPLGGSIDLDGLTKSDIAYLPQQIDIDRSFPISVFDCVAMGLWRKIGAWRGLDAAREAEVARALATVGLQDLGRVLSAPSRVASSSACCSRACCAGCLARPAR